jgi:pyruvate formate lyase activating enzyme
MNIPAARPLVFDILHFALDDGPGIRTTVFLKGCPLSCVWCHNPESLSPEEEIAFYPALCINCGDCEKVCTENAAQMNHHGRIIREKCVACEVCAEKCPSTALKIVGKHYPVNELVEELMKDRIFYETSRGGITFSGGEPTLHMDYLGEVMRRLKEYNIPIAIQTSGEFYIKEFKKKLLPHIDLIFYDIKLFDSQKHREYTGMGNEQILQNFLYLVDERNVTIIPRTPLIPGITATEENLVQIAGFIRRAGCAKYELLPYNPGCIAKMQALGKSVPHCLPRFTMSAEEEEGWKSLFEGILGK